MTRPKIFRGLLLAGIAASALVAIIVATSGATAVVGPTQKVFTFSFQAKANSSPQKLFQLRGLMVNARCDSKGAPVVFAFSSVKNGDLLGHMIDGTGRLHVIKNDTFNSNSKGVSLVPATNGDRDASGAVNFGDSNENVVTVNYAFDNAKTFNGLNVCTFYGTAISN